MGWKDSSVGEAQLQQYVVNNRRVNGSREDQATKSGRLGQSFARFEMRWTAWHITIKGER
jgi:hypothetical protein